MRPATAAVGALAAAAALTLLAGAGDRGAAGVPAGYRVVDSVAGVGGYDVWLDVRTPSGAHVQLAQTGAEAVDPNPLLRGLIPACAQLHTAGWAAPRAFRACGATMAGVRRGGITRLAVGDAPHAELVALVAAGR